MSSPNITVQIKGGTTKVVTAPRLQVSGGGGSSSNSFGVVNVATQNNIVASIPTDTLHVAAGTGILLTTNNVTSTLTIVATGGSATDQFARDQANAAFTKANTANVTGQAAFDRANSAYSNANTAIYTAAQIRANISNTAPVNYDPSTGIISHALSGVVATTYGNTTFVPTISVDNKGHVTSVVNTAIAIDAAAITSGTLVVGRGGTGKTSYANGQLLIGNTVSGGLDSANLTQGFGILITNANGYIRIEAAGGKSYYLNHTNTADVAGYHTAPIDPSSNPENVVVTLCTTALAFNLVGSYITNSGEPNTNLLPAGLYGRHIHATTDGASSVARLRVELYKRAANNLETLLRTNDSPDFDNTNGFQLLSWNVTDPNGYPLEVTDRLVFKLYAARVSGGSGSVNVTIYFEGANRASYITTSILGSGGGDSTARAIANAAYAQANAAYANANTAIYTATQIRANISNTAPINYAPATGVISHALSGVTASGYGDAATVPKVVVDTFGHVSSVTNTAIAISAAAITSGTLAVARGGTGQTAITVNGAVLIANTVSGGYDVNPIAQTAPVIVVNDKGSITLSHASSGVTAKTYGNATLIPAITVDAFGHITAVTNVASTGGTGLPPSSANGQTLIGNTVSGSFDVNTLTQGTGIVITNDKGSITIAATGGSAIDQYARDKANGAAQNSFVTVNVAGQSDIVADSNTDTLTIVGSGITITTNAGTDTLTIQHPASGVVASGYGDAATVPKFVVDANGHVTSVTNTAIAIDASAIISGTLVVVRGGTGQSTYTNGQILIGNTGSTGLDKATIAQSAPVIVTNLQGSITISHARSGVVALDSYGSQTIIPVIAVDANGHITAVVNTAIGGLGTGVLTTGILPVARGGTGKDATGLANGQLLIGNTVNTGFDLTTIAQTAPVIVVNGKGTITLSHASSGVVATGYGAAASIPVFVVDAFGHITSVTNTAIAGLDAGVITTGTLVVARGGTGQSTYTNGQILIGNTGSTGLDKALIAQSAPVIVTVAQGSITISHARSGVVALDSYGSQAIIPVIAVDANGHITAVVNTAIGGLGTGVLTTGILPVARGGTGKDATGLANGQLLIGNTVNTGFDLTTIAQTAPVIVVNGKGTITLSHASSGVVATGYGTAASIPVFVVDAFGHITSVTNTAIAGLDAGVITTGTLVVARGGTGQSAYTNGQILIGNTGSTGLDKALIAQSAPVIVTVAQGSITISHARSGVVAVDSYGSQAIIPVIAVDANGHLTAVVNTAIGGLGTGVLTTGILPVARGGTGKDATGLANGQILIGNTVNTGFDLTTIAQTAPVIVVNGKGTITLSHASSGVNPTTYGNFHQLPSITVDQFGHITAATLQTITLNIALAGAAEINGATANGQVPIGNTVSGGFDVVPIAQTAPVIVTNGKGTITLSHASSGVVATGYGTAASIPVFVVDAFGHVTLVTNTSIAISASQVTSGILIQAQGGTGFSGATANGQTLIGNTVSGGFDRATLTAGSGITINNLKGSIEIVATGGSAIDQFARDTANGASQRAAYAANTGNNEIAFIYSDRVANGLYQSWTSLYTAYQSANSPVCVIGFWAADIAPGGFLPDIPSGIYTFTIGTKFKGLVEPYANPTGVQFAQGAQIVGVQEYEDLALQSNSTLPVQYLDNASGPLGNNLVRYPLLKGTTVTGLLTQFFYCNSASMGIRVDTSSTLASNTANVNKQSDFRVYIIGGQTRINSNAFASNVATGRVDINRLADTPQIDMPQQGAGALFQGGVHYFDTATRIGTTASRPQPSENGSFYFDSTLHAPIYAVNNVWTTITHSGQAEVDFGTTPVSEASFTITDANVSTSAIIIGGVAYVAPTGKDLDEVEMDQFDLKFVSGTGQMTLYMSVDNGGLAAGTFKVNYTVG